MIVYKYKNSCITIENIAAVVAETHLWRGLPYALVACIMAVFFRVYEDVKERPWFRWPLMDPVVYKAVAAFASFVIIFRMEAAYSRRYRKGCEKERYIGEAVNMGFWVHARELWSHSMSPLRWFLDHGAQRNFSLRYFPAGCAKVLDLGVQLNATHRDFYKVHLIGNWLARKEELRDAFNKSFGGNLNPAHRIGRPAIWKHFLEVYPLQVNIHGGENADVFEALRVAQLASNWACIFSQRSHPGDERQFSDVVYFGEPEKLTPIYEKLRENITAIQECRVRTHDTFCEQFSPRQLLLDTGFARVLCSPPPMPLEKRHHKRAIL